MITLKMPAKWFKQVPRLLDESVSVDGAEHKVHSVTHQFGGDGIWLDLISADELELRRLRGQSLLSAALIEELKDEVESLREFIAREDADSEEPDSPFPGWQSVIDGEPNEERRQFFSPNPGRLDTKGREWFRTDGTSSFYRWEDGEIKEAPEDVGLQDETKMPE